MSQDAVTQLAAGLLRRAEPPAAPQEALSAFFRRRPRPPESRRRAVVEAFHAVFRWQGWLDSRAPLQRRIEEALALQERFERHPRSIKPEALAARAVPGWIAGELALATGATADLAAWHASLQRPAPLWLRARPGAAPVLARELGACAPVAAAAGEAWAASCPEAVRYDGTADLYRTAAFRDGRFEIQDLASQWVAAVCRPQPGETWWDACAGEGGKSLALADRMGNRGLLWCSDRSARRLDVLRRRFARARLFNYRAAPWDGSPRLPTRTRFDGVLVDAPCSGVGTWARHPWARWQLAPSTIGELAAVQARLLAAVAPAVKPGGRLVYAVCTLTRAETHGVAAAFSAAHPDFTREPDGLPAAGAPGFCWPPEPPANGMFVAAWRRAAP